MIRKPAQIFILSTRHGLSHTCCMSYSKVSAQNVISVNGEDWQRHRRIVNPAFQEQNNKLVWSETIRQTQALLNTWVKKGGSALVEDVSRDCGLIALHVLSAAGFGQKHDFEGGFREIPSGHTSSFLETMRYLLAKSVNIMLFGQIDLPDWILPQAVQIAKNHSKDFQLYMRESIAYTRGVLQGVATEKTANMILGLIKANETAKQEQKADSTQLHAKPNYLTDDELLGNLFILNVAGFETTANALTYTILYLAAHSEVQAWLQEEVDALEKEHGDVGSWDYEQTFPKLTRCVAVMVCLPSDTGSEITCLPFSTA